MRFGEPRGYAVHMPPSRHTAVHAAVGEFFASLDTPVNGVLAGVSGGADSAAMLFAFADLREELGVAIHAGHLHHGQRAEADAEVTRLQMLCAELDVPFHSGRADVPTAAREAKSSLEVAGRTARYRFLYETAAEAGLEAVATAHTRDDQAETVLLRVLMGTGLEGLGGITPIREAVPPEAPHPTLLLRPVLGIARADAEALCHDRGWAPVRDPSNLNLRYPRNKIRHEVLPTLERGLNPNVREALVRLADIAREDNRVLEAVVDDLAAAPDGPRVVAHVAPLMALPLGLRRRVARRLLARAGAAGKTLGFDAVERLLATAIRGTADLGSGIRCSSDGEHLVLEKPSVPVAARPFEVSIALPGVTELPTGMISAEFGEGLTAEGPWQAVLDYLRLPGPLVARTRRPGDRIRLPGGTTKLGDLMTDRKVPLGMRDLLPVVANGQEVVWVPGLAVSAEYRSEGSGPLVRLTFGQPTFEASAP